MFTKAKAKKLNIDYYEISALQSTNVEMLYDVIMSNINELSSNNSQEQINIKHFGKFNSQIKTIIVGSSCCGKTSFINQLKHNFRDDVASTTGAEFSKVDLDLYTLNICDTTGQERFRSLIIPFLRNQTVFVIMFSLTDLLSFYDVDIFYNMIINNVASPNFKILIFGNKNDLNENRNVSYEIAIDKARSLNAEYLEISCRYGYNFDVALRLIEDAYRDINTDRTLTHDAVVDITQKSQDPSKKGCSCKS